jgi:transposase-like protein
MDMPRTLLEAITYFANPANCHAYMVSKRWPSGEITCPTCGGGHLRFDRTRMVYTCNAKHPKRQFSVKVGTIFEDSPLSLSKWLPTVWMVANMKNGVSSHEVARSLGVTQKTAWFMLHRIRLAMHDMSPDLLQGRLEVDETFIGGKARNMHYKRRKALQGKRGGAAAAGKVAAMGLLERHPDGGGAKIRTKVLRAALLDQREMQKNVIDAVSIGSEVTSDAYGGYVGLDSAYVHSVIDHAERYVNGSVHTNGIENFWSLLKRGLKGTYISVQPFHLFRYLDEQVFRFNNRRERNDGERFDLAMGSVAGRRLTYRALLGDKTSRN